MVVHYTLQGSGRQSTPIKKKDNESSSCSEQACEPSGSIAKGWWAAQVSSNKEYETKREILTLGILEEEDILIPRRMIYVPTEDRLEKRTETVLPGYILINMSKMKKKGSIERVCNYIKLLGLVSDEEMETIKEYENIPKDTETHKGDKIIINAGPLVGVKGNIIEETNDTNSKCRLVFHGNEIIVEINNKLIEKIA